MSTISPSETSLFRRFQDATVRATPVRSAPRRLVVVAPHPDDETLTVGGLISQTVRAGGTVEIVAVTDGGNAYPDTPHDELAIRRRAEQDAAARTLGISTPIRRLGIVDGTVAAHEDDISSALRTSVDRETTLVAPWEHDVHTDHEAVGRSCRTVARLSGCELWSSLFWAWHSPDLRFDHGDLVRLDLSPSDVALKLRALACHRSQLDRRPGRPILTASCLTPAIWASELFLRTGRCL